MHRPLYSAQSMADLVAEADRRFVELAQAAQRTRDLIDQSRDLLAMPPPNLDMSATRSRRVL
jgi:hypothetical protein